MGAFWGIVASNAVVAAILAIVARRLGRVWKHAAAVHVLWVVVLLKLFTPPLITAGLPSAFAFSPPAAGADPRGGDLELPAHERRGHPFPPP